MCFTSKLSKDSESIEERFNAKFIDKERFKPQIEISAFSFPKTPVIIDTNPNEINFLEWGLIPEWSKNSTIQKFTLNARVESLSLKASFNKVLNKRCLIVADGFYEWQWRNKSGSLKQKYLIHLPNHDLFAFAGLYSYWKNPKNQLNHLTYTIVTTEANRLMAEIHNTKKRMPIILKPEDEADWLRAKNVNEFRYPYCTNLQAQALNKDELLLF